MKEDIERAVIHINTASYYELHINGKKVGPYVLEPGITQVNKRFIVNAYDVTSCLVKGTNTIAVWMGPGWHQPRNGNTFNAPILRAQLSVETPSGPMEIGTDASWRVKESCISQIGGWSGMTSAASVLTPGSLRKIGTRPAWTIPSGWGRVKYRRRKLRIPGSHAKARG